jgi:hypothetical protein
VVGTKGLRYRRYIINDRKQKESNGATSQQH